MHFFDAIIFSCHRIWIYSFFSQMFHMEKSAGNFKTLKNCAHSSRCKKIPSSCSMRKHTSLDFLILNLKKIMSSSLNFPLIKSQIFLYSSIIRWKCAILIISSNSLKEKSDRWLINWCIFLATYFLPQLIHLTNLLHQLCILPI